MARPFFNVEEYQRRIDEICGVNRTGRPVVRLVWAPEVEQWALGQERTPRYWTSRRREGAGYRYEQPQRWVFERRLEPEQYWAAHEAARYHTHPQTGEVLDLGPPPPEYYEPGWHKIVRHDTARDPRSGEPLCCERRYQESRQVCWGLEGEAGYRPPADSDLELLRIAVRALAKDYDPYAPLTREQLAVVESKANLEAERLAEEAERQREEASAQFNKLMGYRLTETDPRVLKHGRTSWGPNLTARRAALVNGFVKKEGGALYTPAD